MIEIAVVLGQLATRFTASLKKLWMVSRSWLVTSIASATTWRRSGYIGRPWNSNRSPSVEIELNADGEGTRLVLTHRSVPENEAVLQEMGWSHYLPRLALVAAGGLPGLDTGPR